MPIFSYLAIPMEGASEALSGELKTLPHCQVIPADNADILILVTDAPNEHAERDLQEQLKKIPTLKSLSMTFGCSDQLQPER